MASTTTSISSSVASNTNSITSLEPAAPPTPHSKPHNDLPKNNSQYDPFGYIKPFYYPPSTPSTIEPDNLEDFFNDEFDMATIDPPYWKPKRY